MKFYPISLVGGVLSLVSIVLPWMSLSIREPMSGFTISVGISGADLFSLQSLLGLMGAILPGIDTAVTVMVIGVILVLVGSVISFLHPAGGAITLAGAGCGIAGSLWFGSILSSIPGAGGQVSAGPSFGTFLALIGGVIALVGFVKPIPLGGAAAPPAGYYAPYPYMGPAPPPGAAPPPSYGAPMAPPTAPMPEASAPMNPAPVASTEPPMELYTSPEPPPPAPAEQPATSDPLLVCPVCGKRNTLRFCPDDGTELVVG